MKPNGIITLLTDFGLADGFVGVVKGVIASINPDAQVIDISHQIPSQDIKTGAFILNNSYHYFPKGTIHLAIVDPGVGSDRRILIVESKNYFFIAPDNEILNNIFHLNETLNVIEVLNKKYFLDKISNTFHARDIFAPVAGHLSTGVKIEDFGRSITNYQKTKIEEPIIAENKIIGNIIHIDKFGNLITNINENLIQGKHFQLSAQHVTINKLSKSYSDVKIGSPLAIIGSSGTLEISIRNQNAHEKLQLKRGDIVQLSIS